jgi:hypothetical protein
MKLNPFTVLCVLGFFFFLVVFLFLGFFFFFFGYFCFGDISKEIEVLCLQHMYSWLCLSINLCWLCTFVLPFVTTDRMEFFIFFRWYRDRVHNRNLWWIPHRENTALSYSCCHLSGMLYVTMHWADANTVQIGKICRPQVFSSPELKAQVSFSGCPSVCLLDFCIFYFSRTAVPILTKVGTNHP